MSRPPNPVFSKTQVIGSGFALLVLFGICLLIWVRPTTARSAPPNDNLAFNVSAVGSISGRVTNINNSPFSATVDLSDDTDGSFFSVNTDANGAYSFRNLTLGHNYSVTATNSFYGIFASNTPPISPLTGDVTNYDFQVRTPTFTISGVINDQNGKPVNGITLSLELNGGNTRTVTTDNSGAYTFFGCIIFGNYSVMPTNSSYTFSPPSRNYPNIQGNFFTDNYTGVKDTSRPTITITSPTANDTYVTTNNTINLAGTASDDSDIAQVTWANDRGASGVAMGTTSWTANGITLQSGANVITVTASDSAGNTESDRLTVTYASGPVVTITASDANASEAGTDTGTFTFTRNTVSSAALTVNYAIGGTATNGNDYDTIPSSVTIPANAASATVTIKPKDDTQVEGPETVTFTLSNSGAYTVGSPNSATVTIGDNDTNAPTVSITSPANGARFNAPANITINANATDSDGSVSKVEFFANNNKLGEDTSAPYSFVWNSVAPGSYNLTAKATDNIGASTTSSVVPITIGGVVNSVSAATFAQKPVARESIVAAFGDNLAPSAKSATRPLTTKLDGVMVQVKDSGGVERSALLFYISPGQINYLMPRDTAAGLATITVMNGTTAVATGTTQVTQTEPGLFSATSTGRDIASAYVVRVRNGVQTYEAIAQFDTGQNKYIYLPIDLGPATDQVFLVLYGTGIRFRSSLTTVALTMGGSNAQVVYAGPQSEYDGLDQVNALIPRSLAGRGEVDVLLTVDGKPANPLKVYFK
jgi:uncharacterized protein (TIGR03437 family)